MKNKRIIKFFSLLVAVLILISSISLSAFASTVEESDEKINGNHDENDDVAMNCGPPIWLIPVIIAIAPLMFIIDMFNSFYQGDFSVIESLPELFTDLFEMVFG